ncbi:MAG: helix-turn-helix domain-containing protein [Defluviitaleaceae bacterium]|nr:helix-turn-helix domain-containing protein [Defluviitaleaceae bacterium]
MSKQKTKLESTPDPVSYTEVTEHQRFETEIANFSVNVRAERKQRGYTINSFAKLLGMSTGYVGLIEKGKRTPSLQTAIRICELLNQDIKEMLMPRASHRLVLGENTNAKPERELSPKAIKQDVAIGIINTFDEHQLSYVIESLKRFKAFSDFGRVK